MIELLTEIAKIINDHGPFVTMLAVLILVNIFFIWRDYKREARQQRQIDNLHEMHSRVILPLLTECKEAIAASKEVISQNSDLIMNWLKRDGS